MADQQLDRATDANGIGRFFKPIQGYAFTIIYLMHSVLGVALPRTDKETPMREILRSWHYLGGILLLILGVYLLIKWWKHRSLPVDPVMGKMANKWSYTLVLASLALICMAPFLGILSAWSDGLTIHLGPFITVPTLLEESRVIWLFTGYFHAGIGFSLIFVQLATAVTLGYFLLRYNRGAERAMPGWFALFALGGTASTVYGLSTFSSPEPGPRAVAIFVSICVAVWLLAKLIHRKKDTAVKSASFTSTPGIVTTLGVMVFVMLGMYGPYGLFRVSPIEMGVRVDAPEGVTSHATTVTTVKVVPETALEKQVREENYKWCRFCHTVEKGGEHLAGPNLYGIFGRQIGAVPNFSYTENFAAHGLNGGVWTDERMDELIADPDKFAPGTTMVVSSGNLSDPKKRAALINILKKETMGYAIEYIE